MSDVYTLHRDLHYEFGCVIGVFVTKEAAISHAMSLQSDDEYTVERWTPSDDPAGQNHREVWSMYRGKISEPG